MSRMKETTARPSLPSLPIEVWLKAQPRLKWNLIENEYDCIFQFQFRDIEESTVVVEQQRGREYRDRLLDIETPQDLVTFMNNYSCPLDLPDAIDGTPFRTAVVLRWSHYLNSQMKASFAPDRGPRSHLSHKTTRLRIYVPFRWSMFVKGQTKLKQAMGLPISKLLRHTELRSFFDLKTLSVTAERRDGVYYGIVTMTPSLEACYRIIAIERLLGNVEYGICERCHHPFEVTSGHKRKHCDAATCGHAAAQQAYRERKKR